MEDSEKNRYIEFLLQQKEERDRAIAEKDAFIKNLQDTLDMLKSMHESDSKKIDELKTAHEEEYKLQDLPPEEIKRRRNDDRTTDIMIAMSTRLNELLLDENAHLGDMMQKALRYLNKFWKQLFTYRKDGRYSIDNNIAERNIRPLTVERKNSLFFGNHAKAEMSALYHTFIATCQMMGMSVLKYFKSLFSEIAKGRIDYENMLPMTISLCKVA